MSAICTTGIARTRPDELLGHVEDGVASALTRDLHDHLPGADHLARLGADRGHRAGSIGEQDRVAQLILRDAHLRLSGIDLGLGGQEAPAGPRRISRAGVQPSFSSCCCRQKVRRAWVSAASAEARLACAERSAFCWFCGSSRATTWPALSDIADIDGPLDHASVEAEGEADLVLGANLAGQRNGLALRAALDGDGPDGPGLGGGGRFLVAAREGRGDQDGRYDLKLATLALPSAGATM